MAADALLFHVDAIVADGSPMAFEDGSATLSGVARYEFSVVPSATGNDFSRRSRVPTTLRMRLQFNNAVDPAQLASLSGVKITLRDSQSGRRVLLQNCSFGTLGDVGGGAVDLSFNVLTPPQWL